MKHTFLEGVTMRCAVLFICASGFVVLGCDGFQPKQATPETSQKMDYDNLVAALANRNRAPVLQGGGSLQAPHYAKAFDWVEQKRVLEVLTQCADHADDAWRALVEHLNDESYSLTLQKEMRVSNETVGSICGMIVVADLTEVYMPYIPQDEDVYRKVVYPREVINMGLQEWCRKQQGEGKGLYEMQVELGEWALAKIAAMDKLPADEQISSCTQIRKKIEELRATRKPILAKSIFGELRQPFTQEDASQIRENLDSNSHSNE